MLILDKNFQVVGGIGVCCSERGDDVLIKCTKHVRNSGITSQVIYLKAETPSDRKWLCGNSEKFYYNGVSITEIDEDDFI
ncbi:MULTISPECIES: hypothetical protein [Helicobacter]|uniref:Uncharacterized protein n=3 Tax=Helicobacter bilis TaxID=37372 RepID=C3XEF9_9HELI|nr:MULTISPECIES: hypothetical protein [Helicobacter]AQQ60449.1 hypothetical protein XJ32_10535 [Helicobacter bilis]EEO23398.2 hypothetical protein HRAG_00455 [Helicobacter bilis ATCC 43879]EMZ37842.1 hypothetical protein C826_01925 [Helicobacter bilis WiWa]MCI7411408.1 hypothetical protein [Helicobacter bilis]MDD7296399.1 hypothetical protein [Helicobacter bilis]